MTEALWYYAEGERQKGPVSADELKELVELGRVKPTDLVWQPGMDEWVAAKSIRGLVPDDMIKAPLDDLVQDTINAGFDDDVHPVRRRRRRSGIPWNPENLNQWGGRYGKVLVILGMIAVVGAKGCDSFGEKYAKREQVLLEVAKAELEGTFRLRRMAVQTKINDLQALPSLSERNQQLLAEYQQQLVQIDREYSERQNQLAQTTWLNMDIASRAAQPKHVTWQPYYALADLAGSVILAIGLLLVGYSGAPIERWGSWILLAAMLLVLGLRLEA